MSQRDFNVTKTKSTVNVIKTRRLFILTCLSSGDYQSVASRIVVQGIVLSFHCLGSEVKLALTHCQHYFGSYVRRLIFTVVGKSKQRAHLVLVIMAFVCFSN